MRVKGLEPPRLAAPEPKSGASANFATPAYVVNCLKAIELRRNTRTEIGTRGEKFTIKRAQKRDDQTRPDINEGAEIKQPGGNTRKTQHTPPGR